MFLNNPFKDAFGLDIGDLSIKLIQLRPRKNLKKGRRSFELKELRTVNLPPGLIVNGEFQQPEMVRKKLLHILGKEGRDKRFGLFRVPWAVVGLPEPKTFLKLIEVEGAAGDLNAADMTYHARRHLPMEPEETYMDWQTTNPGRNKQTTQVLIGAVPKFIADSYTYLLESVGVTPIVLEIEAISLARALITEQKDYANEARAILDIGATRAGLIIYDNNSIQFSTNLKFSGEIATTAIMQGLRLEHGEAESLKIKNGIAYDPKHPQYLKIVVNLVDALLEEIKTALGFYKMHFERANPITHVTMAGGAAGWKKLDSFISQKLKISTHPGHPWKNLFNPKLDSLDQIKSLSLASAIGLALRAAQNPLEIGL